MLFKRRHHELGCTELGAPVQLPGPGPSLFPWRAKALTGKRAGPLSTCNLHEKHSSPFKCDHIKIFSYLKGILLRKKRLDSGEKIRNDQICQAGRMPGGQAGTCACSCRRAVSKGHLSSHRVTAQL